MLRLGCRRHFSENICHRVLTIDCLCNGSSCLISSQCVPSTLSSLYTGRQSLPSGIHARHTFSDAIPSDNSAPHNPSPSETREVRRTAQCFVHSPSPSGTFPILFPPSDVAVLWNTFRSHDNVPTGARFRPTGIRVHVCRTESLP